MGFKCCHIPTTNQHSPREMVEKTTDQRKWSALDRRVERAVPAYASMFKSWVRGTSKQISDEAINIAVATGDSSSLTGIFVGLPTPNPEYPGFEVAPTEVRKDYEDMVRIEADVAAAMMEADVAMAMAVGTEAWAALPVVVEGSFTIRNPYVVPSAQKRVGFLITEVRNGTDRGLRQAVVDITTTAYETPLTPRQAARRIRSVIGLRHDQVNALTNIERKLIAEGLTGERLSKRMAREATKRLNYRANLIARTELHRAASVGRHAAWEEARDRGYFVGRRVSVEWVAGQTDRTCPFCMDLDGQTQELGGIFENTAEIPPEQSLNGYYPPIHPNCRCTTVLRTEPA